MFEPKAFTIFKKSVALLNREDKIKGLYIFVTILIGAVLEVLGVALVLPFISLINNPEIIRTSTRLNGIYNRLHFTSVADFLIFASVGLFAFYLFKNIFLAYLTHIQAKYFASKRTSLIVNAQAVYLRSPYALHLKKNSVEMNLVINSTGKMVDLVWRPMVTILAETTVAVVLLGFLSVLHPVETLLSVVFLGGSTFLFYRFVRKTLSRWAVEQFSIDIACNKWAIQGLLGIREIKLLGKEEYFLDKFLQNTRVHSQIGQNSEMLNQWPRLFIETVLVSGICLFVFIGLYVRHAQVNELAPTLALFAVTAFRLMPSMTRIVSSNMLMRGGLAVIDVIEEGMKEVNSDLVRNPGPPIIDEFDKGFDLPFENAIEFCEVAYSYGDRGKEALKKISLNIKKGQSVGFVGHSGGGKTTLINIFLGLLTPSHGEILVDGQSLFENPGIVRAWQKKIGFIPQQINFFDDSIRRNVAFGLEDDEINEKRIWEVLRIAQLEELVKSLPEGLETPMGERGIRLSAGQQQRVGMARALYYDPEILVLDEATAALDNETERAMSAALENMAGRKTMLIIAHRLTTVARCEKLFFIRDGQIVDVGTYKELIAQNRDFSRLALGL